MSENGWPRPGRETLPWTSRMAEFLTPRQRVLLPSTYEAAVVPEIADAALTLSTRLAAAEADAVAAVSRFDSDAASALLPFTPLLLRSESSASSRIEQLTVSARRLMEAELFGAGRGNAALVVANTRAMTAAASIRPPLSLDSLLSMHRALLESSAPDDAGALRREPVWIGGSELSPAGALFVPPRHERVPEALEDLFAFTRRTDLPPLTRTAIAHAHFETIHPFVDGNGRTGRALIHVLLSWAGLTPHAPLPLSAVLLADVDSYFRSLDAYRRGEPLVIVELFIGAAARAAALGRSAGRRIGRTVEAMLERSPGRAGTPDRAIIELLARRPVLDAGSAATAVGVSEAAARRSLERLEAAGLLRGYLIGPHRRAWRSPEILDLMDDVASALGRRARPGTRREMP
ncbi:cell filamentation protein Fic [Actinomyces sp. oral taxon 414]|uniref:Fic family protein n=1 Tax=Actinomyces sp. oral taxon 414 TaxID=712122 RepID=UPI0006B06667|nr:Fic family protein [Actinomyces sp. oral taxon 414]ALD00258.1 cell filamentation protein Fic [Actinomyces sp. oral taxon 414]